MRKIRGLILALIAVLFIEGSVYARSALHFPVIQPAVIAAARQAAFADAPQTVDTRDFPRVDPDLIANQMAVKEGVAIANGNLVTVFSVGMYAVTRQCDLTTHFYMLSGKHVGILVSSSPPFFTPTCLPQYPIRALKYDNRGQLLRVTYSPRQDLDYNFLMDGTLEAEWAKDQCYKADGSSCGTRNSFQN